MKTIRIICIALIGLVMISCNKTGVDIDYGCNISYQLENKTDKSIFIKRTYGQIIENGILRDLIDETTIQPNTTKEIYNYSELCGKNTMIDERQGAITISNLQNTAEVYVDNQLVNEALLDKDNWSFSATEYYKATYLLVVTDELIESVGYKSE